MYKVQCSTMNIEFLIQSLKQQHMHKSAIHVHMVDHEIQQWCFLINITQCVYMWLDMRKSTFHAYNSNAHFSSSNDSCTH